MNTTVRVYTTLLYDVLHSLARIEIILKSVLSNSFVCAGLTCQVSNVVSLIIKKLFDLWCFDTSDAKY